MMKLKIDAIDLKRFLLVLSVSFFLALILSILHELHKKNTYANKKEYEEIYNNIVYQTGVLNKDFENIERLEETDASKQKEKYELIVKALKEKIKQKELRSVSKTSVNYFYYPSSLEEYLIKSSKLSNISDVISSKAFKEKDLRFDIEFYGYKTNVRGRYVGNTIKLFNVKNMPSEELLSVFIHEFGHYFDVKYLEKQVFFDLSDRFYSISWLNSKTLKKGSRKEDFVSGYAMSNKYEDFAESFTYYVLFNDDFKKRSEGSKILKEKYNFFEKYIFKNGEFKETSFGIVEKRKDYYRDTTKIKFSTKNFLEYLKKGL